MRISIKICNSVALCVVFILTIARNGAAESARERGATEFHEKGCIHCHTIGGVGGHKGPDLSGVGLRKNKDGLRKQILEGKGAMPAFREVLTGDEVEALVRYLHHCRTKPGHEVVVGQSSGE